MGWYLEVHQRPLELIIGVLSVNIYIILGLTGMQAVAVVRANSYDAVVDILSEHWDEEVRLSKRGDQYYAVDSLGSSFEIEIMEDVVWSI